MKWYGKRSINIHDQGLVMDVETGTNIAVVYNGDAYTDLIAAAPELLEALKACVEANRRWAEIQGGKLQHCLDEADTIARAAIAKAKGE
jgi:hypothetical protein